MHRAAVLKACLLEYVLAGAYFECGRSCREAARVVSGGSPGGENERGRKNYSIFLAGNERKFIEKLPFAPEYPPTVRPRRADTAFQVCILT